MHSSTSTGGWRGAALVAVTYFYFLIFAQFGFLARLTELGIGPDALRVVMAAMAVGGVAFSLLVPRWMSRFTGSSLLRFGFVLCFVAAASVPLQLPLGGVILIAFLIGAGLGIVTVSLVTHLPRWTGRSRPILWIGLGTGVGYGLCNVPAVFDASPSRQAMLAALSCAAGALIVSSRSSDASLSSERTQLSLPLSVLSFAALVWLDSAAFFIIQHATVLKDGTWAGAAHLWTNCCTHFLFAIVAALLLERRRVAFVLVMAVGALGFACTLLLHPVLILSASLFYPAGVSLYSVALVAYPAFLSGAKTVEERARRAGWIYAIAGWVASALGIGMGKNLGYIPTTFVVFAGLAVVAPALWQLVRMRMREVLVLAAGLGMALALHRLASPRESEASAQSAAERGRQVYVSEGCIHCHSQYVRPGTTDEMMWGPAQTMQEIHAQKPPLIGNRRQGPDLARIGNRRSALWLKAHLVAPSVLSDRSPMPSYAFLFQDDRGDALVDYLMSLQSADKQHARLHTTWQALPLALSEASASEGRDLYRRHCATCHEESGEARALWGTQFSKQPSDLTGLRSNAGSLGFTRLEQIAKFGIPGTDMPGHEYLSDREVASLVLWLTRPGTATISSLNNPTGDLK